MFGSVMDGVSEGMSVAGEGIGDSGLSLVFVVMV